MEEYGHLLQFENFQTSRSSGDIDLLLGMERCSLHPKPLIVFKQDLMISLIRQPVKDNKCLILAGTTENIHRLTGDVEIYVTSKLINQYYDSLKDYNITMKDLEIHSIHCTHEKHEHPTEENSIEEPEEEDYRTDSEEEEETEHNVKDPLVVTSNEGEHNTDSEEEQEEHNPKDPLPGNVYMNAEQVDTWITKQESFLTNQDLGDSVDSVDTLTKEHADIEKSLAAQEKNTNTIAKLVTKLVEGPHRTPETDTTTTIDKEHEFKEQMHVLHIALEKALTVQEENVRAIDELATKLIEDLHNTHDGDTNPALDKDSPIASSDEENYFTADEEEEEEEKERDQRYSPNTTVHMEQTHNDIHATPTSPTTGKENELKEQVHFLYITQPRNKTP